MNPQIQKLYTIASKAERLIIGLMSGTSMDGLDIALCSCKGSGPSTRISIAEFETIPYDDTFRSEIKSIFSKRDADLQQVCILNEMIATRHAEMILQALDKWNLSAAEVDLVASHGQTIFHAPRILHAQDQYPNATLQIGDGDHIAVKTGIITIADFRQKHVAAGGEGAPLAVYGDFLMFSDPDENRVMLNIGGIANFTFLPADGDAGRVFSTDVGPGNTLMDQYVQRYFSGSYYDKDSRLSSAGVVSHELLAELYSDPFFTSAFPKTTGPELFNLDYLTSAQERSGTTALRHEDVLATLCMLSARGIINAVKDCFSAQDKVIIYMSGGGMHNPLLVDFMKTGLPDASFKTTADLGIDPDAKEAVLFAVLANETIAGGAIDFGSRQGVPSICMGKICLPD
ncbi:anhydro-N-acetylmuramic acid kinase [Flavihumibacter sp. R14]|nr:anhydro-N-acetylmuramic acid kinase [Flavihumibacter soli]